MVFAEPAGSSIVSIDDPVGVGSQRNVPIVSCALIRQCPSVLR